MRFFFDLLALLFYLARDIFLPDVGTCVASTADDPMLQSLTAVLGFAASFPYFPGFPSMFSTSSTFGGLSDSPPPFLFVVGFPAFSFTSPFPSGPPPPSASSGGRPFLLLPRTHPFHRPNTFPLLPPSVISPELLLCYIHLFSAAFRPAQFDSAHRPWCRNPSHLDLFLLMPSRRNLPFPPSTKP